MSPFGFRGSFDYTVSQKTGLENSMGMGAGMQRRDLILLVVGLGLYWPFFTHPLFPPEFASVAGSPAPLGFMFVVLGAMAAAALLVWRAQDAVGTFVRGALLAGEGVVAVSLCAAQWAPGVAATIASWLYPAAVGACMALATARWSLATSPYSPGVLAVALTASLALSTVLNIVAYDAGAAMGFSEVLSTQALPFLCGLLGGFAPLPAAVPRRDAHQDADNTSAASVNLRWLVMGAALLIYILGSGVFRNAFTEYVGTNGVGQDWFHRGMLLLLSCFLVAWAWAASRRHMPDHYPWVAFLVVCLIALYCGVMLHSQFFMFANEIMLPTRPVAIFLLWVACVQYARCADVSPALTTTCVFLPVETLIRTVTALPSSAVWASDGGPLLLEGIMLATALALTLALVVWLRLLARDGRENAERQAAAAPTHELLREQYGLTERESEVMALLARGYTQKRIAEELGLSINSVQTYAKTLYRKLDIHSRQELIDLATREG